MPTGRHTFLPTEDGKEVPKRRVGLSPSICLYIQTIYFLLEDLWLPKVNVQQLPHTTTTKTLVKAKFSYLTYNT